MIIIIMVHDNHFLNRRLIHIEKYLQCPQSRDKSCGTTKMISINQQDGNSRTSVPRNPAQ